MANLSDFFGGSVSLDSFSFPYVYRVTTSSNWVAPYDGLIRIWCIGAGGSGGASNYFGSSDNNPESAVATGGGGGGCAYHSGFNVTVGQSFSAILGAGGNGVTGGTNRGDPGNAGGNSIFTGTGIHLTGGGGGAGAASFNAIGGPFTTDNVTGGVGGTASGGTSNFIGGSGGSVNSVAGRKYIATGGGSAAYLGNGGRGGNIYSTTNTDRLTWSTGGGGVLGNGGDITGPVAESVETPGGGIGHASIYDTASPTGSPGTGLTIPVGEDGLNHAFWSYRRNYGAVDIFKGGVGNQGASSSSLNTPSLWGGGEGGIPIDPRSTFVVFNSPGGSGGAGGPRLGSGIGGSGVSHRVTGFGGGSGGGTNAGSRAGGTGGSREGGDGAIIIQYVEIN